MAEVREVNVDIGGTTYTITSDEAAYLQTFTDGFEPGMVKVFRSVAANSETILDIGANIGCTALLFSQMAKAVYAFEPSQTTFSFLQKNVSRAGAANIFPQNVGLGEAAGEFPLTFSPNGRSGGFVSNQTQAGAGHVVEKIVVRTMDEMVKSLGNPRVNFIKIDVEGFEGKVLQGGLQTLAANKPVVVLELNHWCLNAFQRTSVPDFFDFLRGLFPILVALEGDSYQDLHDTTENYRVMYHHILRRRFCNLLAAYDESQVAQFRAEHHHRLAV